METRLLGTKGGLVQRNINGAYEFEAELYFENQGSEFDLRLHENGTQPLSSFHHFAEAILTDTLHIATGEEGLLVMKILDALYESANKRVPVKV